MRAEFAVSAGGPDQFPMDGLPEYAFLGRSNVGKSSLINALVGQRELAFTSRQPGRTATINFYRVDGAFYLVDLPGYGYARVSHETSEGWKEIIERYLLGRATLERSVLVMDARRGWMEKKNVLNTYPPEKLLGSMRPLPG